MENIISKWGPYVIILIILLVGSYYIYSNYINPDIPIDPDTPDIPIDTDTPDIPIDPDTPEDDIDTGVYMRDARHSKCNDCKIKSLSNEKSQQFSNIDTIQKGKAPLCFNHGDAEKKCCAIKQDDIYFGCPNFCFEEIQNKLDAINAKDEKRYKSVMNENSYCNTF